MSENLTVIDREFENKRRMTHAGMAHWAGTGPRGTTCGDCFYLVSKPHGLGSTMRCDKYRQMMKHWGTAPIPRTTPSCKYFIERK